MKIIELIKLLYNHYGAEEIPEEDVVLEQAGGIDYLEDIGLLTETNEHDECGLFLTDRTVGICEGIADYGIVRILDNGADVKIVRLGIQKDDLLRSLRFHFARFVADMRNNLAEAANEDNFEIDWSIVVRFAAIDLDGNEVNPTTGEIVAPLLNEE